ncbi:hypothetical protein MNBD_UNCLBAC01-1759 [hydrothermal vent metagenome]|uniref:Uncharacterized protein n=1 Tax=hydrothermal vent metagenome TaxID=652676 RepID=A0A3B1DH04_9ZZZZ
MSKAAKQSVVILVILLVASLGFAGYMVFEKQKLEKVKVRVEVQLKDTQKKEDELFKETRVLKGKIKNLEQDKVKLSGEKTKLSGKLRDVERKSDNLSSEINRVKKEKDKWKRRVDEASSERDKLMERIQSLVREKGEYEKKLVEAGRNQKITPIKQSPSYQKNIPEFSLEGIEDESNEQYWASVLRHKASLEVEIEDLKEALSDKVLEIVELRRSNEDVKSELEQVKHEKEESSRDIKHKGDLINNLSLELARTKNDKKFVADRIVKLEKKNENLRGKVKRLVSTKGALEKSIVRLTQDKGKIEKELGKTETLIQSKIDEIWEIKDSLDQTIKKSNKILPSADEVELSPIVVSNDKNMAITLNSSPRTQSLNGRVVSINKENNFVVVDIGQNVGLQLGDALSVYRGSQHIARLEVIQLRKDIAAADLKDQASDIKVGDTVR